MRRWDRLKNSLKEFTEVLSTADAGDFRVTGEYVLDVEFMLKELTLRTGSLDLAYRQNKPLLERIISEGLECYFFQEGGARIDFKARLGRYRVDFTASYDARQLQNFAVLTFEPIKFRE